MPTSLTTQAFLVKRALWRVDPFDLSYAITLSSERKDQFYQTPSGRENNGDKKEPSPCWC